MPDDALHIGVDAREVLGRPTGVGRYLTEITRAWATDATIAHTFTFFLPHARPDWPPANPRFRVVVAPGRGSGTWWAISAGPRLSPRAPESAGIARGATHRPRSSIKTFSE